MASSPLIEDRRVGKGKEDVASIQQRRLRAVTKEGLDSASQQDRVGGDWGADKN